MRNFLCFFLILVCAVSSDALVPLNPILGKGGARVEVTINDKPGFVGWLDVWIKGSKKRVLAAKTYDDSLFCYYHPRYGNKIKLFPESYSRLPKGLFVFEENIAEVAPEKTNVPLEKQYGFFTTLSPERAHAISAQTVPLGTTPLKKFVYLNNSDTQKGWYADVPGKQARYNPKEAKHSHPTPDAKSIVAVWPACDNKNQRLFRPWVFYDALGVTEDYYREFSVQSRAEFFPIKNHLALGNGVADIELVTLKDTLKSVYEKLKGPNGGTGSLKIIDGYQRIANGDSPDAVFSDMDTRALLENPANANAGVQVASNLDGLEGGMANPDALITNMQNTPTQGEEASLASMGATFVRKYLAPRYNMIQAWVDKKYLTVHEGRVSSIAKAPTRADAADIATIVHKNVMVTSGFAQGYGGYAFGGNKIADLFPGFIDMGTLDQKGCENSQRVYSMDRAGLVKEGRDPLYLYNSSKPGPDNTLHNPKHTVTQIFTAALDLDPWRIKGKYENNEMSQLLARTMTTGMYVATILEAIRRDKKKLYLTLVGAGSFKNPLSWISDAFHSSFTDTELFNTRLWEKDMPPVHALTLAEAIRRSGIEVYLMIYPDPRPGSILKGRKEFVSALQEAMKEPASKLPEVDMANPLTSFAQALTKLGTLLDDQYSQKGSGIF